MRAGFGPARIFACAAGLAAAACVTITPAMAADAPSKPRKTAAAKPAKPVSTIEDFYRIRNWQPLWLGSKSGDSAQQLISLLKSAEYDGIAADRLPLARVEAALAAARSGDPKAVRAAEIELSTAFVSYVQQMKKVPDLGIIYVDYQLKPAVPTPRGILLVAAGAPSLPKYIRDMGWMNPTYVELRKALVGHAYASETERETLAINMDRARALPAGPGRYVLVNAAAQRLEMVEDGQTVDSMRVVVGKPKYPTPMMAALIRFASLNPYWYVPPDLAAERIAPNTVRRGLGYLNDLGYQVLDQWDNPTILDPATVDWKAVSDGKTEVLIRQLPGPHNSMGRMKFMFPNVAGVYLHDNPERELFEQAARLYSGGCVRLEDASRLGRWLFGRELEWRGAGTEEKVPLDAPVPVYITYLTAVPKDGSVAFLEDVYSRDASRLAAINSSEQIASKSGLSEAQAQSPGL